MEIHLLDGEVGLVECRPEGENLVVLLEGKMGPLVEGVLFLGAALFRLIGLDNPLVTVFHNYLYLKNRLRMVEED